MMNDAFSLQIRPLEEADIQAILKWNRNTNEAFLHQWSGYTAYRFPLTADQIRERNALPTCRLFAALQNGETVAAAEIDGLNRNEKEALSSSAGSDDSAHLCRILVSNEKQNKGIGGVFLRELCTFCFSSMGLSRLTLRVFCFNIGALRCYEKCGFLTAAYHPGENGKKASYTMELTKDRFFQLLDV